MQKQQDETNEKIDFVCDALSNPQPLGPVIGKQDVVNPHTPSPRKGRTKVSVEIPCPEINEKKGTPSDDRLGTSVENKKRARSKSASSLRI
ncbi:hypothetical protein GH714_006034 [Hevea brasiliensis]|uniref:Uncharacterized protein n=1 Tax=Hevea brasiliensis TaxID=3981 RepID=A0A6A6MAR5_HEVBR|nr:hypothetical protein GH714_006034 [Hevea brasiliensis]